MQKAMIIKAKPMETCQNQEFNWLWIDINTTKMIQMVSCSIFCTLFCESMVFLSMFFLSSYYVFFVVNTVKRGHFSGGFILAHLVV